MSFIEIENLTKIFDNNVILKNINLSIEEGEFFSLLGFSGCGKTTTLKSITGIYSVDKGDIKINNKSIKNIPMEKRNLPFVLQEPYLFPHMKVYDNIAFGLKVAKFSKEEIKNKVNHILDELELKGLENMYPAKLSGGQRQRVSLGRALVMSPKILLLDEPFSSLDITLRSSMRKLIKKLHKERNLTIIFVTHDKEEALTLSDKIALMSKGEILQVGTPYELYESPENADVAMFFGNCNLIKGIYTNGLFESSLGIKESILTQNKKSGECNLVVKSEDLNLISSFDSPLYIKDKQYIGDRFVYEVSSFMDKDFTPLKSVSNKNINLNLGDRVSLQLNNLVKYKLLDL